MVIDTRHQNEFHKGFIPGAIFLGIDGSFATWVGTLIEDLKQRIVLICEEGREEEVILRLARVGYDNAIGFLIGGVATWESAGRELQTIDSVTAVELETLMSQGDLAIADVRKPTEYSANHIKDVVNYPLNYINDHLHDLDKQKTWYLHCRSGYRSMLLPLS